MFWKSKGKKTRDEIIELIKKDHPDYDSYDRKDKRELYLEYHARLSPVFTV